MTDDGRSGVCGDPVHFHVGAEYKIALEPAIILLLRSAAVIVLGRMCKPDFASKIHVQVTPHSQSGVNRKMGWILPAHIAKRLFCDPAHSDGEECEIPAKRGRYNLSLLRVLASKLKYNLKFHFAA